MSGRHVSLPALDIEREQKEIDSLIASLQQYKPASRSKKESHSSNSVTPTPKVGSTKNGRGRPPKNKEVLASPGPVVCVGDSSNGNSLELIVECLNKLNAQNQRLSNRVSELDSIVSEQNKTIESLKTKVDSLPEIGQSPSDSNSLAPEKELFTTVVKRVEKIEQNINSHLLICRGPTVISKIVSSTVDGVADIDKIKAEICAEVCGDTVSRVSVTSLGVSIYGKSKKTLRIECASVNVRNHLLEQARKRKPTGIYLSEFLSPEKLLLLQQVRDLKREFSSRVRAVYIRRGDIFCKSEPDGDVIRVVNVENVNDLRRQLANSSTTVDDNAAQVTE